MSGGDEVGRYVNEAHDAMNANHGILTRAVRGRLNLAATYDAPGFPSAPARIVEISRTGMQLRVGEPLTLGGVVRISFDPGIDADPQHSRSTSTSVYGRVVRLAAHSGASYTYGIDLQTAREIAATLQWLALRLYAAAPAAGKRIA